MKMDNSVVDVTRKRDGVRWRVLLGVYTKVVEQCRQTSDGLDDSRITE